MSWYWIGRVHDPVEVVVDVAEVDGGLRADHRELAAGQAVHDLALGRADAAELHHVALEGEDAVQGLLASGFSKHLHLDELDLVLDRVEAREVVLEHLVEDLVEQEVARPRGMAACRFLLHWSRDGRDRAHGPLVVRDQVVRAQEDVQLAGDELVGGRVEADAVDDQRRCTPRSRPPSGWWTSDRQSSMARGWKWKGSSRIVASLTVGSSRSIQWSAPVPSVSGAGSNSQRARSCR